MRQLPARCHSFPPHLRISTLNQYPKPDSFPNTALHPEHCFQLRAVTWPESKCAADIHRFFHLRWPSWVISRARSHSSSMAIPCFRTALTRQRSATNASLSCSHAVDLDVFNKPTDGFQLLHTLHAVESFLHNLRRHRCRFHIVWFDDDEDICVPPSSEPEPYLLTRAILLEHLARRSEASGDGKLSFQLSDMSSAEYEQYLMDNAVFFSCISTAIPTLAQRMVIRQRVISTLSTDLVWADIPMRSSTLWNSLAQR
ncbi:hypothetical protein VUR80DRAFT_7275 [Thermomyces stellatus]